MMNDKIKIEHGTSISFTFTGKEDLITKTFELDSTAVRAVCSMFETMLRRLGSNFTLTTESNIYGEIEKIYYPDDDDSLLNGKHHNNSIKDDYEK